MIRTLLALICLTACRYGFEVVVPLDANDESGSDSALPTVAGALARYDFDMGSGTTVPDLSGESPALDLQLGADTVWVPGGIEIGASATATRSIVAASRLVALCIASGETSIEAWIEARDLVAVGAARIAAIAANNNVSVASLGQEAATFYGQTRTPATSTKLAGANGSTTTSMVHLVHTHATDGERTLYLNGAVAATTVSPGGFSTWDQTLPLTFGDALDGGVRWRGRLFFAAFYCRALAPIEVQQSFAAGP